MRARTKHQIEVIVIAVGLRLVAALPVAWGLSLLLHRGGTYWPSLLIVLGIRLAAYREDGSG